MRPRTRLLARNNFRIARHSGAIAKVDAEHLPLRRPTGYMERLSPVCANFSGPDWHASWSEVIESRHLSRPEVAMRRSIYLPYCLVLACAWPIDMHSQAQNDSTIVHLDPGTRLTPFEQTILEKEKETCDRAIKRDFTGWAGLISDDALAVYNDGYATKAEVLEAIKTMIGGHCIMDKVKFTAINKKAGLITYRMTQDWEEAAKAQSRQYYISSLWVNRRGKWITSFWQETDTTSESQVAKNEGAGKAGISSENTPSSDANSGKVPPDSFFIAKEEEDWEALKHKDKATATRLLADDFVGMYDFGFFNKSEWVKQMDEQYAIDGYSIESARVLHPSANTALLLYNSNCKGTGTWTEACFHTSCRSLPTGIGLCACRRWKSFASRMGNWPNNGMFLTIGMPMRSSGFLTRITGPNRYADQVKSGDRTHHLICSWDNRDFPNHEQVLQLPDRRQPLPNRVTSELSVIQE
jgi:hypothetical protein